MDSYLITLFSPSSCPITLWWIHEIIIIVMTMNTSHSAEVGTDQIVTVENENRMQGGKQLPPNRKCQLVNAKYRMNMHTPPVIVENINVAIKHIGYI